MDERSELMERARALIPERWQHLPGGEIIVASIAAALQSEREAAALRSSREERDLLEKAHAANNKALDRAREEREAAVAVLEDEQAAHQDTLRLWQQAKAEITTLTEQRDRALAMLRKVERVLYADTAAPDEPRCGWGPLWVEVRAVLDTSSSPSLPGRTE